MYQKWQCHYLTACIRWTVWNTARTAGQINVLAGGENSPAEGARLVVLVGVATFDPKAFSLFPTWLKF